MSAAKSTPFRHSYRLLNISPDWVYRARDSGEWHGSARRQRRRTSALDGTSDIHSIAQANSIDVDDCPGTLTVRLVLPGFWAQARTHETLSQDSIETCFSAKPSTSHRARHHPDILRAVAQQDHDPIPCCRPPSLRISSASVEMLHRKRLSDRMVRRRVDALPPQAGVPIRVGGEVERPAVR